MQTINNVFLITDFGAIGDGKTLNTENIQKAIDCCAEKGGGTVAVPCGVFVSGTLKLKSNVTFLLMNGATLKGSEDISQYRFNGYLHNEMGETLSLIYALDACNIRITGEGQIDLSADAFMDFSRHRKTFVPDEKLNDKQKQQIECEVLKRPNQPIFFHNCSNIRIDGITIKNSPCWTVTMSTCRDIKIHNVSIYNHLRVPNSDGIHFCSCKDAIVSNCVFSCGDDCIAITGITNWEETSERIIISNCTMRTRSAGVRVGHLASKVRDIIIRDLCIYDSNRGIAIFAGDNGWVKNIIINGLIMDTHKFAGGWWGKGEPFVISAADSKGVIESVSISNVKTCSENGFVIAGKEQNVKNIDIKDINIVLQYGENNEILGFIIDIQPAQMRNLDKGRMPWVYIEDACKINIVNSYYSKQNKNDERYDISPYLHNVEDLRMDNVISI